MARAACSLREFAWPEGRGRPPSTLLSIQARGAPAPREAVSLGKLRVPFVATADNVADFFTKPLMGKDFFRMRDRVMNVAHSDRPSP